MGFWNWIRGLDEEEKVKVKQPRARRSIRKRNYRYSISMARRFLQDRLYVSPDAEVEAQDLEKAWQEWKAIDGNIRGQSSTTTGRRYLISGLRRLDPELVQRFSVGDADMRRWMYRGVGLK